MERGEKIHDREKIMQQAIDQGFDKDEVERAYELSFNKSLEGIVDWLCDPKNFPQSQNEENPQIIIMEPQDMPLMDEEPTQDQDIMQQEQPQGISHMVKQDQVEELKMMGFSQAVSEKSLFLTQNKGIEQAINWIEDNKFEHDFEEPLQIVQEEDNKPKMTEEEAKQKAKELQERLRAHRAQKDLELAFEQEKKRVQNGKLMTAAAAEQEEVMKKIALQEQMRQKAEDQKYKEQLLQQIEEEKKIRLGDKYRPPEKKVLKPDEQVKVGIQQLLTAHPENLFPGMAKTALSTIQIYIQNVLKDQSNDKFRKINTLNNAFQNRVSKTISGVFILNSLGFQQNGDELIMVNFNEYLLKQGIELIKIALSTL